MGDQYQAQAFKIVAPKPTEGSCINTNTTANSFNLANVGTTTQNAATVIAQGIAPGCVNRFVRFQAIGASVWLNFGPNSNAVSGSFAPNAANTGASLNSFGEQLQAGNWVEYYIDLNTQWMGYVAVSGSGTLQIRPSSQPI